MLLRMALASPEKGITIRANKPNQTTASSKPEMMRALGLRLALGVKRLKIKCHKTQLRNEPTVLVRKATKKTMSKRTNDPARAME